MSASIATNVRFHALTRAYSASSIPSKGVTIFNKSRCTITLIPLNSLSPHRCAEALRASSPVFAQCSVMHADGERLEIRAN